MPELITRRGWLLNAIRTAGHPIVTTHTGTQLLAGSPWPTAGRNTVRKDLRALARRGHLAEADKSGRHAYTLKDCT